MTPSAAPLERRQSVPVFVGKVKVGGGAPVVVQSMTNTDTADAEGTARQVAALARAAENWTHGASRAAHEAEARMADRVRHRALCRLGGVAPVDIDAHAHFGDAAGKGHGGYLLLRA